MLVKIRNRKHQYLLIIKYEDGAAEEVRRKVEPVRKVLNNKTGTKGVTELTYEVRLRGEDSSFVTELAAIEGVTNAALIEFTGDYSLLDIETPYLIGFFPEFRTKCAGKYHST